MRTRLLLATLAFGLASCQSSRPVYPTGIYSTATAFRQQQPNLVGSKAGRALFQRKLFVVNATTGGRTKVALDSVWGYAGSDGQAYRIFRRASYLVEQPDTLAIYSQLVSNGRTTYKIYYFSAGLASPVQPLSQRRLKRAFADNATFVDLLAQLKWYQSVEALEGKSHHKFKIVDLYRHSLALPNNSLH